MDIRPARKTDSKDIAKLFYSTDTGIYDYLYGPNAAKYMAYQVKKTNNHYSFKTAWVAEEGGE